MSQVSPLATYLLQGLTQGRESADSAYGIAHGQQALDLQRQHLQMQQEAQQRALAEQTAARNFLQRQLLSRLLPPTQPAGPGGAQGGNGAPQAAPSLAGVPTYGGGAGAQAPDVPTYGAAPAPQPAASSPNAAPSGQGSPGSPGGFDLTDPNLPPSVLQHAIDTHDRLSIQQTLADQRNQRATSKLLRQQRIDDQFDTMVGLHADQMRSAGFDDEAERFEQEATATRKWPAWVTKPPGIVEPSVYQNLGSEDPATRAQAQSDFRTATGKDAGPGVTHHGEFLARQDQQQGQFNDRLGQQQGQFDARQDQQRQHDLAMEAGRNERLVRRLEFQARMAHQKGNPFSLMGALKSEPVDELVSALNNVDTHPQLALQIQAALHARGIDPKREPLLRAVADAQETYQADHPNGGGESAYWLIPNDRSFNTLRSAQKALEDYDKAKTGRPTAPQPPRSAPKPPAGASPRTPGTIPGIPTQAAASPTAAPPGTDEGLAAQIQAEMPEASPAERAAEYRRRSRP